MAFDFPAYLTRIDPSETYIVTKLTGGVVNFTVRASRDGSQHAPRGRFAENESIILKQAPPYVAGVGESAPFSPFRQTIEARALSLFLPQARLLHSICTRSSVSVPELLLHDEEEHVLVLSDLGALPNLSEIFSALGSHVPMASPAPPSVSDMTAQRPLSYYVATGEKIGSFFARLHSSTTVSQVMDHPDNGENFLHNPKTKELVHEFSVKRIKTLLKSFPNIVDAARSEELFQRVEDDYLRQTQSDEIALALGDCWPGAILVGTDEDSATVGVIDWEFACFGRGLNGDISQLLAHLSLFKIAAEWREDEVLLQRITTLIQSIANAYRGQSIQERAQWVPNPKTPLSTYQATIIRSACLAHGSEMINSAFWKNWICANKACGEPHPADKRNCQLIQRMIKTAVWNLDQAGADENEFMNGANWHNVQDKSIMAALFYGS